MKLHLDAMRQFRSVAGGTAFDEIWNFRVEGLALHTLQPVSH
jgi:hypothetical protein